MLQPIIQFGATVNGQSRSACDVNSCNEVYCGVFHSIRILTKQKTWAMSLHGTIGNMFPPEWVKFFL